MKNKTKEEIFRWGYRLLLALAIEKLHNAHNNKHIWPGKQEWGDLVGSSQSIFLTEARLAAEVDDWYLEDVRDGKVNVDDIWEEFEKQHQK